MFVPSHCPWVITEEDHQQDRCYKTTGNAILYGVIVCYGSEEEKAIPSGERPSLHNDDFRLSAFGRRTIAKRSTEFNTVNQNISEISYHAGAGWISC